MILLAEEVGSLGDNGVSLRLRVLVVHVHAEEVAFDALRAVGVFKGRACVDKGAGWINLKKVTVTRNKL